MKTVIHTNNTNHALHIHVKYEYQVLATRNFQKKKKFLNISHQEEELFKQQLNSILNQSMKSPIKSLSNADLFQSGRKQRI